MPALTLDPAPLLETLDSGLLRFRDNVQLNYDKIQSIVNALDSANIKDGSIAAADIASVPWTTYTPTLTADTVNPTLGTAGFVEGRYIKLGRVVIGWANVKFGSAGAAAGTGFYRIAAPVAGLTGGVPAIGNQTVGAAWITDDSAGNFLNATVFMDSGTSVFTLNAVGGGVSLVSNAFPWVWANLDTLRLHFIYESAT